MQVEFIRSFAEMKKLRDEWADLFQNAIYRSLYGEPEFCLNWLEHFGKNITYAPREYSEQNQMARPIIVVGRNSGRVDLLMPIKINPLSFLTSHFQPINALFNSTGLCSLTGLINSHTDVTNILIRSGSEDFALKAIPYAISRLRWHTIYLGAVPSDSSLSAILASALAPLTIPLSTKEESTVVVAFGGSFPTYLASRNKLRKEVFRARRRLEYDFGPLELEWWKGQDAIDIGFRAFLEVDSQSWKAATVGGEALVHASLPQNYYSGLTKRFAMKNKAHVFGLRLNGILAAAELGFESNGILYTYKASYKEIFASKRACRPGFVLCSLVIENSWPFFSGIDFMSSDGFSREWKGENFSFEKRRFITSQIWRRGFVSLLSNRMHA